METSMETSIDRPQLPRILIIDDLFGRTLPYTRNEERANLCGQFLLEDVTGDEIGKNTTQKIRKPVAEAYFHRGQSPLCATLGDTVVNDLPAVLGLVKPGWEHPVKPQWSMVLLDLCFYTGPVRSMDVPGMPDGQPSDSDPQQYFGLRILEALHERFPDLPVVILSSQPRADVSKQFTSFGAVGFLEREARESSMLFQQFIARHALTPDLSGKMIGRSRALLKALRAARRAAHSRQNILIRGERGSGKELLAQYVHYQSELNVTRPYVVVDSGALSPDLYASTLFGHKKGAFTGADENRIGAVQEAMGGDLFLDEIGNLPMQVQSGLLRALEYRRVRPLGGTASDERQVDLRFLSATNLEIERAASTGEFREDLYDRLREGGMLFIPALRDRREDIPILAQAFVRQAEARTPNALKREIEPATLDLFCEYDWPGNVRELRSSIFQAVANHPDVEYLQPVHFDTFSHGKSIPVSRATPSPAEIPQIAFPAQVSLQDIVSVLDRVPLEEMQGPGYLGKFSELETVWARFMARYLKAGLQLTRRITSKHPEGELLPLPALQLLTGDPNLKAWKAYDIIKSICRLSPELYEEVKNDPVIGEVLRRAQRSRRNR